MWLMLSLKEWLWYLWHHQTFDVIVEPRESANHFAEGDDQKFISTLTVPTTAEQVISNS